MTMKKAYEATNAVWPDELPELTDWEAVRAASRLWRWAMGEACPYNIVATNKGKYSWVRHGVLYVVPKSGWAKLVHDLSHLTYWKANYGIRKSHSKFHAKLEGKMAREVIKRGWLDGRLKKAEKPELDVTNVRVVKLDSLKTRKKRLQTKIKALNTRVKKIDKSIRYYERQLAA